MRGFTLWNKSTSGKKYREYAIHQAKNYAAVFQTYRADIALFEKTLSDGHRDDLETLRMIVDEQLRRLLNEVQFWDASPYHRLKILLRDYLRTGYGRTGVRLLLTWLFPLALSTWQQLYSLQNRKKL